MFDWNLSAPLIASALIKKVIKIAELLLLPEVYLGPCQTSIIEIFMRKKLPYFFLSF